MYQSQGSLLDLLERRLYLARPELLREPPHYSERKRLIGL
jgi:hypothetical protein